MFDRAGILTELVDKGACKILAGTVESRAFCDLHTRDHPCRPGPITPGIIRRLAGVVRDQVSEIGWDFDAIAPVPLAAEPFALALKSLYKEKPEIIWLEKVSSRGERRIQVAKGVNLKRRRILLLNEVVDRGKLTRKAVCALLAQGCDVVRVATIVDRGSGGRETLLSLQVPDFVAAYSLQDLLAEMLKKKRITSADYDELLRDIQARRERTIRGLKPRRP